MTIQADMAAAVAQPVLERELRFVPMHRLPIVNVVHPRWHAYETSVLPTERHVTTYYDTPSLNLARAGITCRRRVFFDPLARRAAPTGAELTIKLPRSPGTGPLFARSEYSVAVSPNESPTGHRILDLVQNHAAGEPVAPWFVAHLHRSGRALRQGDAVIHMTWDRLSLPSDPGFVDDEIEAELVSGPMEVLEGLADLLISIYGLSYGDTGKRTRAAKHLATLGLIEYPSLS